MQGGRKQYGLQLQIKGPPKKTTARPAPASAFRFTDDDDEDNVEAEIARQANKKRTVRPEVEQQLKKALAEDPNAFDYDGVYEEMKGNQARPIHEDRAKREPKYIGKLIEKAKVRAREQDVIYERQLAKEREKEDHLYGDKEKFVTGAYKKKLQEQTKWLEEERRREMEEQKHEVTNKSDMSDFYRNLLKSNVAFGARNVPKLGENDAGRSAPESHEANEELRPSTSAGLDVEEGAAQKRIEEPRTTKEEPRTTKETARSNSATMDRDDSASPPPNRSRSSDGADTTTDMDDRKSNAKDKDAAERSPDRREPASPTDPKGSEPGAPKRPAVDPVAAAKERYLARKKQRGL